MPVDEYLEQRLRLKYYWRFTPGVPDVHIDERDYNSNGSNMVELEVSARGRAFCRGRWTADSNQFRVCILEPDEQVETASLLDHPNKDYGYYHNY